MNKLFKYFKVKQYYYIKIVIHINRMSFFDVVLLKLTLEMLWRLNLFVLIFQRILLLKNFIEILFKG